MTKKIRQLELTTSLLSSTGVQPPPPTFRLVEDTVSFLPVLCITMHPLAFVCVIQTFL